MTKEKIVKELSKVRGQISVLLDRQKDLEGQLHMAEDAEKLKFLEKNKISLERLSLLNRISEEEILGLLRKREQEGETEQTGEEKEKNGKNEDI